MAHGGENHLVHIQPGGAGSGFVDAGERGGQVEHPENAAALGACVTAVPAADIVRRNAALLIGRPGQCHERVLFGDEVLDLHSVSHGVDVLHRGFHAVVDHNAALYPQR